VCGVRVYGVCVRCVCVWVCGVCVCVWNGGIYPGSLNRKLELYVPAYLNQKRELLVPNGYQAWRNPEQVIEFSCKLFVKYSVLFKTYIFMYQRICLR